MKRVWKMFTRLWMKLNRAAEQSYTTKINAEEQSRASAQTHQFPWWQGRRKGGKMPDLWIADIAEDVFGALQTLARSAKGAEEVWMREYISAY